MRGSGAVKQRLGRKGHRTPQDITSPAIVKELRGIPAVFRATYKRAMLGLSLRDAITTKCLDCSGWRAVEVKSCELVTCPLYPYRSYQEAKL